MFSTYDNGVAWSQTAGLQLSMNVDVVREQTETYNLLNAWAAVVPGNRAYNLRRLALLETHAADLSFLFTVDQGRAFDLAGRAPLATLVTVMVPAAERPIPSQSIPR